MAKLLFMFHFKHDVFLIWLKTVIFADQ